MEKERLKKFAEWLNETPDLCGQYVDSYNSCATEEGTLTHYFWGAIVDQIFPEIKDVDGWLKVDDFSFFKSFSNPYTWAALYYFDISPGQWKQISSDRAITASGESSTVKMGEFANRLFQLIKNEEIVEC